MVIANASPAAASGTPKKTMAEVEPKSKEDETVEGGANNDVAATPTGDGNADEIASPPSTPKKGASKPKAFDEDDEDATPTQAMPKKRAPKVKVKTEDVGDGQAAFTTPTSTPKKRSRKPMGETPSAPKRVKKANGKGADMVNGKVNEAAEKQRMAATIAASKTLQKFTLGSDDESGDEQEDEQEDEQPGVKELKKIMGARFIAERALEVLAHGAGEDSAHGDDESLAHQDCMFPDKGPKDDGQFDKYTPKAGALEVLAHDAGEVSAHGYDEPLAHQDGMFVMDEEIVDNYTPKSTSSNTNKYNASKWI